MVEWKAVIIAVIMLVCYILYRRLKELYSDVQTLQPQQRITATEKTLIQELNELQQQHTNLSRFLLDYQEQKETTYNISYIDITGEKRKADLFKAADTDNYLKSLTEQQLKNIENRIETLTAELHHLLTGTAANKNYLYMRYKNEYKNIEERDTNTITGDDVSYSNKLTGDTLKGELKHEEL